MARELVILNETEKGYGFVVKNIGEVHESWSVLAGQTKIQFVDSFDTLEAAQAAFPDATVTHELLMPMNSVDHLPDDEYGDEHWGCSDDPYDY